MTAITNTKANTARTNHVAAVVECVSSPPSAPATNQPMPRTSVNGSATTEGVTPNHVQRHRPHATMAQSPLSHEVPSRAEHHG